MTKTKEITDSAQSTIRNICMVAAEKFKENSELFRQIAEMGGNPMVTVDGAKHLERQFLRQSIEARLLGYLLSDSEPFTITYDEEEFEETERRHIAAL